MANQITYCALTKDTADDLFAIAVDLKGKPWSGEFIVDARGDKQWEWKRLPELPMTNPWKPIETAPKNGTQILTFNCGWYQTSYWSKNYELFVGWPDEVQPTHWMLLPDFPPFED